MVHVLPLIPFQDRISFKPDELLVNESRGYVTIVLMADVAVPVNYSVILVTKQISAMSECVLDCVNICPFLT